MSSESVQVRIITGAEVCEALPMKECIEVIDRTMRVVSRGRSQLPLRTVMTLPHDGNVFAVMPGFLQEPLALGAKLIAVYPRNPDHGRSSHRGVIVMFDVATGAPAAFIDASAVTALRTAAASAVATRALARQDASELAILGTGEQAHMHLHAIAAVRNLRRVRIWGRSAERAASLAEEGSHLGLLAQAVSTANEAVADADIICTTTASREPVLRGEWLTPGVHVNLAGAAVAAAREADDAVVTRSRFVVDYREAALAQAGELLHAIQTGLVDERHIVGEIGQVLNAEVSGRRNATEITVYKSLGIAAQDLAVGQSLCERLGQSSLGTRVQM